MSATATMTEPMSTFPPYQCGHCLGPKTGDHPRFCVLCCVKHHEELPPTGDDLAGVLRLCADGRAEYAANGGMHKEFLLGQAAGFRAAAELVAGTVDRKQLIASEVPSWRWPDDVDRWVMSR